MSFFVIIRGPLASGKSTIATELAHRLNGAYLAIDPVLEQYELDKVPPDAECIPAENFIKANDVLLSDALRDLKAGKPVVFDACFYHREVIDDLTARIPYEGYVFTLKAPLEVCIERDRKRKKSHGPDAAGAVHSLVSRFDLGTPIDGTKPVDESIETILSRLPKQ